MEIVVKTVLKFGKGIVGRQDLYTDERSLGENLLIGFRKANDTDVGDAVTSRPDLNALLRKSREAQSVPAVAKPGEKFTL